MKAHKKREGSATQRHANGGKEGGREGGQRRGEERKRGEVVRESQLWMERGLDEIKGEMDWGGEKI